MKWQAKYPTEIAQPTSWQQLPAGQAYCNALTHYFAHWFPQILGEQILKIGGLSGEIEDPILVHQQIILTDKISQNLTALLADNPTMSIVQAQLTELPFLAQSIDCCVLANTLNFCQDPHQLLREVDRVLREDGYLFLSLFNPISHLMFSHHLTQGEEKFFFRKFFIYRILDWLSLLSFEILERHNLPIAKETSCFSSMTVIVAQKRSHPLTLNPQKVRFDSSDFCAAYRINSSAERHVPILCNYNISPKNFAIIPS